MRDLGANYMDYIPHPDEPKHMRDEDPIMKLEIGLADRQQLKKHVWSRLPRIRRSA